MPSNRTDQREQAKSTPAHHGTGSVPFPKPAHHGTGSVPFPKPAHHGTGSVPFPKPLLFFDVGSPYAYLAFERAERVLGGMPELRPVLLGGLFRVTGRSSWAMGDFERRKAGMAEVERRAAAYGLPPIRWPEPWPGDYLYAMRVATLAHAQGAGEEFARAAMRAAFAAGRDLGDRAVVDEVAAAAGLDAAGAEAAEIKEALRAATDAAHAAGVFGVPTVAAGGELYWGDDRLEEAARALGRG